MAYEMMESKKDVIVSTLIMSCDPVRVDKFAENIFYHLDQLSRRLDVVSSAVIRINASEKWLGEDKINMAVQMITKHAQSYGIEVYIISDGLNIGFGAGHNANLRGRDARLFLILNDDLLFPHLDFVPEALLRLENRAQKIGVVAAAGGPARVNEDFGFSYMKPTDVSLAEYADGAILAFLPQAWREIGGFNENFEYAYFEDVDVSFRLQATGWGIDLIPIPHEHARASTSTGLGSHVYSRLYEHNRAVFMSRWAEAIRRNQRTGRVLVELAADGIGDLIDFYYPVKTFVEEANKRGTDVVILVRDQKVRFIFESLAAAIVTNIPEPNEFDNRITMRHLNFSAPLRTIDLVAARLGLSEIDDDEAPVRAFLARRRPHPNALILPQAGARPYAAVHIDSQRLTFHGRAVPKPKWLPTLERILRSHNIALIGQPDAQPDDDFEQWVAENVGQVVDYRAGVVEDMFHIIDQAAFFVGIDSGPMHIAQLLAIPTFAVFGSVHPVSKVYRTHNTVACVNEQLKCIGCYHMFVEPSYNFCMRTDLACVEDIEAAHILARFEDFAKGEIAKCWAPLHKQWNGIERRAASLQLNNPLFRNRLLEQSLAQKVVSDAVLVAVDGIAERVEARSRALEQKIKSMTQSAEAERIARRDEVQAMRRELMKERVERNAAQKALAVTKQKEETDFLQALVKDAQLATIRVVDGMVYTDGWATATLTLVVTALAPVATVGLTGWTPQVNRLSLYLDGQDVGQLTITDKFAIEIPIELETGGKSRIMIKVETPYVTSKDKRNLGFVVTGIELQAEDTPPENELREEETDDVEMK